MTNDQLLTVTKLISELQDKVTFLAIWTGAEFPEPPKAQPKYKGQGLNQALANFYDAAVHVNNAWEKAQDENIYLDDPHGKYPFMESFEEIVYKIGQWVVAVDEELKQNYPEKEQPKQ